MLGSPLDSPAAWTLAAEARALPASSRYPGRRVLGVRCTTPTPRAVRAPLASVARGLEGDALLELEPAAFALREALEDLSMGLPELYFWLSGETFTPPVEVAAVGAELATTGEVWLGVAGQDGLLRDPMSWAAALREAWAGFDDVAGWQAFEDRLAAELPGGAEAPVLLTDHTGAPLAGRRVRLSLPDGTLAGNYEVDLLAEHGGDLQQAVAAAGAGIDSVFAGGASEAALELEPAGGGEPAADQWAGYDGAPSAAAESAVARPSARLFSHTDLHRWFAPQQVSLPPGSPFGPGLARFRRGNRVLPLVDGRETFADMVRTIRAVEADGGSVNFGGWAFFHRFQLVPPHLRQRFDLPEEADLSLQALASDLSAADRTTRLLVNRFFNLEDTPPVGAAGVAALLLVFTLAFYKLRDSPALESRAGRDLGLLVGLIGALGLGTTLNLLLGDDLELFEPSEPAREDLDELEDVTALWTPYPATRADNPLAGSLSGALADFAGVDHVGVYHQKMMVARHGDRLVGYLGGIDVNPNRLDDPDHAVEAPYHDAHARLEGPGAEDLFHTFRQRWRHDSGQPTAVDDPPAQADADRHIVQIARTYFRADSPSRALPFAPDGDFTLKDTLIRGIEQARQFIYIEDQYFTPPEDYRTALLDALPRIEKLIVVVPRTTDQPFGALHRQSFFEELQSAGGDKVMFLAPVRRPHSAALPRIAAGGRCELREPLAAVPAIHEEIALGPSARVPRSAPFWLAVEGELMYVHEDVALPLAASGDYEADGDATSRFRVQRGGFLPGRLEVEPRAHEAGAPAMVTSMDAIYVHAKLMIVDDVFLSLGSANLNRRGLFHDGELNLFAISDRLRADRDANVARALRIRLWADHLGLPERVAAPLVADPIAGSRLLERPFFTGNRAVHPNFLTLESVLDLTPGGSVLGDALKLLGLTTTVAEMENFFDTIVDPTTQGS